MTRFVKYHLPALLFAAVIIILSSIPDLGEKQSFVAGCDKLIHFCEYAIFAILIYRSFSHMSARISFSFSIALSMLFIVLFALLDEYYQSHIPGRESDLVDALFDILGAVLIVIVLAVRHRIKLKSG